jgi:hypothetical protein
MKRVVVAVILALTLAAPAHAGSGTNSITVDQPLLHFGETVTFTASVKSTVTYEFVQVSCDQPDEFGVLRHVWGADSRDLLPPNTALKKHIGLTAAHDPGFVLGYPYSWAASDHNWNGGAASCVADIYSYPYGGVVVSTTFEVSG